MGTQLPKDKNKSLVNIEGNIYIGVVNTIINEMEHWEKYNEMLQATASQEELAKMKKGINIQDFSCICIDEVHFIPSKNFIKIVKNTQ